MTNYLRNLGIYEKAGVVPLVIGSSGWGKSDGVRMYAAATNRPCLEFYASMIGAEDIGGFPFVVDGVLYRANDSALEQALDKPVVLFLDEINQAKPDVINAMFPMLRERKVNGRQLDKDTFIVCAGNELDDNPYLTELPPAFVNRTEKCPPPKSWSDAEFHLAQKFQMSDREVRDIRKISEVTNPARLERIIRLIKNGATEEILAHITSEMIAKQLLKKVNKGVAAIYEKIALANSYASSVDPETGSFPTRDMVKEKFGLSDEEVKLVKFEQENVERVVLNTQNPSNNRIYLGTNYPVTDPQYVARVRVDSNDDNVPYEFNSTDGSWRSSNPSVSDSLAQAGLGRPRR